MSEKKTSLTDEADREGEAEDDSKDWTEEVASDTPHELAPEDSHPEEVAVVAQVEEDQEEAVEEAIESPAEMAQEEAVEEAVEVPVEEAQEEAVEEAVEAPAEMAQEEALEEAVEAPVEEDQEEALEEEEVTLGGPVLSSGPDKDWYVVHTYSGYEAKVKASMEERISALGLKEWIPQIIVPSEPVVEMKGGKKRISDRKFFPGYVLVEMELSDDTWYLIKNTPKVTGILGGGRNPTPLATDEIRFIVEQMRGEAEKPKLKVLFERGENVRIVDGPFTNFTGMIEEVDDVRAKLRVMVTIFGRATPIEMEFLQVEKV